MAQDRYWKRTLGMKEDDLLVLIGATMGAGNRNWQLSTLVSVFQYTTDVSKSAAGESD